VSRPVRYLVILEVLAVLLAPLVMSVMGREARLIENRPLTPWPATSSVASYLDLRTIGVLNDYVRDRLPVRPAAVEANAWLTYHLFHDSPTPDAVGLGPDGWLSLRLEVQTCSIPTTPEQVVAELSLVDRILAAGGRRLRVVVVPDKTWVYPEKAEDLRREWACARDKHEALVAAMRRAGEPWLVDLWRSLAEAKERGALYHAHDSHMTDLGRLILARELVESLRPGLWREQDVRATGPAPRVGDLSLLMGLPMARPADTFTVERPGVTTGPAAPAPRPAPEYSPGAELEGASTRPGPQRPVIRRPALAVGDSQLGYTAFGDPNARRFIAPFFEQVRFTPWQDFRPGQTALTTSAGSAQAAAALVESRDVVLESAERELYGRVHLGLLERFVTPAVEALPAAALGVTIAGSAGAPGREVEVPAGGADLLLSGAPAGTAAERLVVVRLRARDLTTVSVVPLGGSEASGPALSRTLEADERVVWLRLPDGIHAESVAVNVVSAAPLTVTGVGLVTLPADVPETVPPEGRGAAVAGTADLGS
jgi:hypothetical protein